MSHCALPLGSLRSDQSGFPRNQEVRVRLTVFDVSEISISSSRFTCNFWLEASWLDGTLNDGDSANLECWESQFPYMRRGDSLRWTPRLDFYNILELKDKEEWFQIYTKSRDGTQPLDTPVVCYRLRASGVFRERFELKNFPFDAQDLQMQIVSVHQCGGGSTQVELVKNETEEYVCVVPGDDGDRFTLYDEYMMSTEIRQVRKNTLPQHSTTKRIYPLLVLSMKVTRRPGFYIWQVYLPMFMLVVLTFPVLLLPISDLSGRLSSFFTLMLAAVAYKNWIGDNLPRCSYLTELDIYVLGSISIMFMVTLESSTVFWVQKYLLEEGSFFSRVLDTGEDCFGISGAVTWMLVHVWFYHRWQERTNNPEGVSSALERSERKARESDGGHRSASRVRRLMSWHSPATSPVSDLDEPTLYQRTGEVLEDSAVTNDSQSGLSCRSKNVSSSVMSRG
eukprot:TRINITY_DN106414_c0_g1_i1.p1 TRINITY_DN106414_c0_g1~~TRINITY_DN106414_c0_g1_i1.p1  ORF type:complete len:450 (+),score=32.89 TRINITY_DN106414_c0_g1_i1:42-1391(+)